MISEFLGIPGIPGKSWLTKGSRHFTVYYHINTIFLIKLVLYTVYITVVKWRKRLCSIARKLVISDEENSRETTALFEQVRNVNNTHAMSNDT